MTIEISGIHAIATVAKVGAFFVKNGDCTEDGKIRDGNECGLWRLLRFPWWFMDGAQRGVDEFLLQNRTKLTGKKDGL